MKKDANIQLMDDLMNGIIQTDEWENIQNADPVIAAAFERFSKALDEVKSRITREQYVELSDAVCHYVASFDTAAILYGMHIATSIRDIAARPADLSGYILRRMNGGKA